MVLNKAVPYPINRYIGATVTNARHTGAKVVLTLSSGATISAYASDPGSSIVVTGTVSPDSPITQMTAGVVNAVSYIEYESGERTDFLSSGGDTHVCFLLN